MVHIVFTNPYYSTGIAIILSLLLAFAHKIEQGRSKIILVALMLLTALFLVNTQEDFGLLLLLVALIAVVFAAVEKP
jgi:hypothetical protein